MAQIHQNKIEGGVVPPVMRAGGATGDLRLHEFRSRIFRNTRLLRVWLPLGYDDAENSGKCYPVLYLNDGQNLFEASTAFGGVEWRVGGKAGRAVWGGGGAARSVDSLWRCRVAGG